MTKGQLKMLENVAFIRGYRLFFFQVYNSLKNTIKLIGTNLFSAIDFLIQTE